MRRIVNFRLCSIGKDRPKEANMLNVKVWGAFDSAKNYKRQRRAASASP